MASAGVGAGVGVGTGAVVGAVAGAGDGVGTVAGAGTGTGTFLIGPSLQICSIFPRFMACELELLQNYIFLPLWPGLRLKRQEIDALLQDSTFPQLPLIEFLQICSNQERTNRKRLLSRPVIQSARLFRWLTPAASFATCSSIPGNWPRPVPVQRRNDNASGPPTPARHLPPDRLPPKCPQWDLPPDRLPPKLSQ